MPTALLTGVGRKGQVGEAVAARLAADGFELLLVDRTPDGVEERAAELRSQGRKVRAFACDLASPDAVAKLFSDFAPSVSNRLDAVVHMAGGFAVTGPVAETQVEAWARQLTINLTTAFVVARSAIPLMRSAGGSLVFFSSESALPGAKVARVAPYAVAKTGVVTLSTAIAQEEAANRIRSNVLAPGSIRTASNVESTGTAGRFVERDEVAATVSYLCSESSSAVTGQIIHLTAR